MDLELCREVHQEIRLILSRTKEGKAEPKAVCEILLRLNGYLDVSDAQYLSDLVEELAEQRFSVNDFMKEFARPCSN